MHQQRTARPAVGGEIEVSGYGRCVVESNSDPSLVALRTPSGAVLRIGERALARMIAKRTHDVPTPTTGSAA